MRANVQDKPTTIWIDAGKQRFRSFVELNAWLGARCHALQGEVLRHDHDQFSLGELPPVPDGGSRVSAILFPRDSVELVKVVFGDARRRGDALPSPSSRRGMMLDGLVTSCARRR